MEGDIKKPWLRRTVACTKSQLCKAHPLPLLHDTQITSAYLVLKGCQGTIFAKLWPDYLKDLIKSCMEWTVQDMGITR